jgi:hypothetical protein
VEDSANMGVIRRLGCDHIHILFDMLELYDIECVVIACKARWLTNIAYMKVSVFRWKG